MYGKLIDGRPVHAPAFIVDGENTIYNPGAETLEAHGWLPIVKTQPPEQGSDNAICYISEWQEQDGQIVQIWVEAEPEDTPHVPTLDERMTDIEGAVMELAEIISEIKVGDGDG